MGMLNSYLGYSLVGGIAVAWLYVRSLHPSPVKRNLKDILLLTIGWILIMQGYVLSDFFSTIPDHKDIDYLIVLGAGLKGDQVSHTLAYRLDTAISYSENHPDTKLIVSGGQGPDELVPEGIAMARYLLARNVDPAKIIIENASTSTEENIKLSLELVDNHKTFAIVTSNYHMFRAKYIARPYILNVEGLSAPSPYWSVLNYMIRESVTIANEWRKDIMNGRIVSD